MTTPTFTGMHTVAVPVTDQERTKALFERFGLDTRLDTELQPGFRWIATRARFLLGATGPQGRMYLALDVPEHLGASAASRVTVDVTVNDRLVSRSRLTAPGPIDLVTECIIVDGESGARLRIQLATNRSFVPAKLGINKDPRELSLRIERVEFRPEERC